MNRKEYSEHETKIGTFLLNYAIDNGIDNKWMSRLIIDVLQSYVVRFSDDD